MNSLLAGRGALALALLAGAGGFDRCVAPAASRLRLAHASPRPPLEALVAEAAAVRRADADRRWMDLLQYCGDLGWHLDRGERLIRLAGRVTDLDPSFVQAYAFAGTMLWWSVHRPHDAVALLEKGVRMNPGSAKLKHYLAAITYERLHDLGGEIAVLDTLARAPDSPVILRRILVNAYDRQGQRERAMTILRLIWKSTPDPAERRWVEAKLRKYGRSVEEMTH